MDAQAGLGLCCSQVFALQGPYDVEAQASWPPPGYVPAVHPHILIRVSFPREETLDP